MVHRSFRQNLIASALWLAVGAGFFMLVGGAAHGEQILKYKATKKIACFERDDFLTLVRKQDSHLLAMAYADNGNVVEFWHKKTGARKEFLVAETMKEGRTCIPVVGTQFTFYGLYAPGEDS